MGVVQSLLSFEKTTLAPNLKYMATDLVKVSSTLQENHIYFVPQYFLQKFYWLVVRPIRFSLLLDILLNYDEI